MNENESRDENVWVVDDETWEWLQQRLDEPPREKPRLAELLRKARGTVEHGDD